MGPAWFGMSSAPTISLFLSPHLLSKTSHCDSPIMFLKKKPLLGGLDHVHVIGEQLLNNKCGERERERGKHAIMLLKASNPNGCEKNKIVQSHGACLL